MEFCVLNGMGDSSSGSVYSGIDNSSGAAKVSEGIPDKTYQAHSILETLETESFSCTLKYRIEDFSTANEEVCKATGGSNDLFLILISVSVFPNGADKSDEGWLVVRPVVTVRDDLKLLKLCTSLFTVSIIDIEGNSRFFRYFEISSHNVRGLKYFKKSFILERADELITDDVLFLRCDVRTDFRVKNEYKLGASSDTSSISFFPFLSSVPSWEFYRKGTDDVLFLRCDIRTDFRVKNEYKLGLSSDTSSISFFTFLSSVPSCEFSRKGTETDDPSDTITIHDFTSQILTLPQFHESRKRFGVYGIPPPEWNKRPEVDNRDSLENVWIFDTESWRCLLSFDQRPGNVGPLLLDASPVIRRCINAPMKERHEKRIELSHVNSAAFLLVLHFLESGELPTNRFQLLKEIVGIGERTIFQRAIIFCVKRCSLPLLRIPSSSLIETSCVLIELRALLCALLLPYLSVSIFNKHLCCP